MIWTEITCIGTLIEILLVAGEGKIVKRGFAITGEIPAFKHPSAVKFTELEISVSLTRVSGFEYVV